MDSTQASQHIERLDALAEHRSAPFAPGRSMRWRIFGRGEPLVLLHGGHGSWLHWIRNVEALSRSRQLLVPDLPGYGDSDDPPEGADLMAIVDAFVASLDHLLGAREPIDLAGFSLGAVISAHALARRGAVKRLALVGSPGTDTPRRTRAEMIRWRNADPAAQAAALRHNLLAHMMFDEAKVDALALEVYTATVTRTRYHTRGVGSRYSLAALLEDCTGPVLFVYGEEDVTGTPQLARDVLVGGMPQREFHIVPRSGHWVQFEAAEDVNAVLTRWFGGGA